MSYAKTYLTETVDLIAHLDTDAIDAAAQIIADTRNAEGRLFVLGVGGSAATASHAVGDFRKCCGIEAYTPTDNVPELTAWTNDSGWRDTFVNWLDTSNIYEDDCVLVFSVNGGTSSTSPNIVAALDLATEVDAQIIGVVGCEGGYTATVANACIAIPPTPEHPRRTTPQTEGIATVVSHLLTSHPLLAR